MELKLQKRMFAISVDNVKMKEVTIGMGKTEGVTVPHVVVNPFKKKFSFVFTGNMTFKGEITADIADMCNQMLPKTAMSRCLAYTFTDKYFHVFLWLSRYLANLDFNKEYYEKKIRQVARVKVWR